MLGFLALSVGASVLAYLLTKSIWLAVLVILGVALLDLLRPPSFKLQEWPSMGKIYVQALGQMGTKPKWKSASSLSKIKSTEVSMLAARPIDSARLSTFKQLMNMEKQDNEGVPMMYFIVEPFCLCMYALLHGLPLSIVGSVLLKHTSQIFRKVKETEKLKHHCLVDGNTRRTEKDDIEVDFVNTAQDESGQMVWKSVTTVIFLNPKRSRGAKKKPQETPSPIEGDLLDTWRLGGDTGRRYGALNRDINPIHLYPWSSQLFGFKKPIAHALYQVSRSVATLENKLGLDVTEGWEVSCEFKRPTMLPCTLNFLKQGNSGKEDTHKFCITTEDGLKEVLTGTLSRIKQ